MNTDGFEPITPELSEAQKGQKVRWEIKRTRHRKELPLYCWLIFIGFLAVLILLSRRSGIPDLQELIAGNKDKEDIAVVFWTFYVLLSLFSGIGAVVLLLISMIVSMYRYYGGQLAYSVRVSEVNFPEIYAKVQEYTRLLGLTREPEVYVRQMNGQVNAYTSWIPGRAFIQLNAEIVDLAYMENRDFDTVFFVMAHEFGHIQLHHVQLHYIFWPALGMFFPVIGQFVYHGWQRAREYSADRVAQALTDGQAQLETMMMLSAGRHAYKHVDAADYLERITAKQGALARFARWCINFGSTHPIHPYRVQAILDPEKRSGRLV